MKVSVSVSNFGSAWYQYQYRNFRPAEYQYRIGIEFVDQESISIVSEKVASKGSAPPFTVFIHNPNTPSPLRVDVLCTSPYCKMHLSKSQGKHCEW